MDIPRIRTGLHVEHHTTPPGPVELQPKADHRVRIHAGAPVRGRCRIQPFVYTRGDVDVFPAGVSDRWEESSASTFLMVSLAPSLIRRAAEDMGLDPDRARVAERHLVRAPQIEHIAWALDAEHKAGYPSGLLYTESLGLALAAHLLGDVPAAFDGAPRLASGLSAIQNRRVTAYIDAHLDRDLSLARLARIAGVSASHFKVLFRRSTGLAVHQFVVQRRVERAQALLERGDLPVSQVALETGFAHQSHLARWMRRLLGATPAAVMRASINGTGDGRDAPRKPRRVTAGA
jgi:AraC family transcriptional regulator